MALNGSDANYYKLPEDATELQDLIEQKKMNFSVGNIFKAAYRLGQKEGTTDIYDLEKIIFFAQREINRIKKCTPPSDS
jgi:hypothetical protein